MNISLVVPCLNQHELTKACIGEIARNSSGVLDEIIVIDNGSDVPFSVEPGWYLVPVKVVRNEKSTGVYPTFQQGFKEAKNGIVAFFHSDLVVWEKGWDERVLEAFEADRLLGMVGFIGSNEIDQAGGRGLGTTSNFMGKSLMKMTEREGAPIQIGWTGSPAEPHGKRGTGLTKAAVVDGCAMIITREAWEQIGYRPDYLFHHFYDKIISVQILEARLGIAVLGIECDHFSGQTANQEGKYRLAAVEWGIAHGIKDINFDNADQKIYLNSEEKFLREYRDEKHLIPIKV